MRISIYAIMFGKALGLIFLAAGIFTQTIWDFVSGLPT